MKLIMAASAVGRHCYCKCIKMCSGTTLSLLASRQRSHLRSAARISAYYNALFHRNRSPDTTCCRLTACK